MPTLAWFRGAPILALTLLQLLEALEGDLELVGRVELGGVVLDLDTEKRDDRHDGLDELKCAGRCRCWNNTGVGSDKRGVKLWMETKQVEA